MTEAAVRSRGFSPPTSRRRTPAAAEQLRGLREQVPVELRRGDLDAWASAGVGIYLVGRGHIVWQPRAGLCGATFWGRATPEAMAACGHALDLFLRRTERTGPVVIDLTRLLPDGLSEEARALFERDIVARLATGHSGEVGLVVAAGLAATALLGTVVLAAGGLHWRVFASLAQALSALVPDAHGEVDDVVARALAGELGPLAVVHRVRSVLAAQPAAGLTLTARALAMTARSLQRALAMAGTSFANERTEIRLELAAALLDTGRMKVDAVSRAVGYGSPTHFIATFRERYGETPSAFRARRSPGVGQ